MTLQGFRCELVPKPNQVGVGVVLGGCGVTALGSDTHIYLMLYQSQ